MSGKGGWKKPASKGATTVPQKTFINKNVEIDCEPTDDGIRFVITDCRGTRVHDFPIKQGEDGDDGFSPTINCTETDGGLALFFADVNGQTSKFLPKPADGEPGDDAESPFIDCDDVEVQGRPHVALTIRNPGQEPVTKLFLKPRDGIDADPCEPCEDGFSPLIDCTQSDCGDVILQITDVRGPGTPKVIPKGQDGQNATIDCEDQPDGSILVTFKSEGECTVKTLRPGKNGEDGQNGTNGEDGQDGVDGKSATISCEQPELYELNVTFQNPGEEPVTKCIKAPVGPRGNDGQDGEDGDIGPAGPSAYDLAVQFGGFQGSLADWLLGLQGADGEDGSNGTNGTDGDDGFSPVFSTSQSPDGDVAVTITDANGSETFIIPAGQDGSDGDNGTNGIDGTNGTDGQSATIGCVQTAPDSISLTIQNPGSPTVTKQITAPAGQKGDDGEQGPPGTLLQCDASVPGQTTFLLDGQPACTVRDGSDGDGGSVVTCRDNGPSVTLLIDNIESCTIPKGENGQDGADGEDGFTPTVDFDVLADGSILLQVTNQAGTSSVVIPAGQNGNDGADGDNGTNGTDGTDGDDGFSPTIDCTSTDTSVTFTITDINGTRSKTIDVGAGGGDGCCNTGLQLSIDAAGNLTASVDQSGGATVTDTIALPSGTTDTNTFVDDIVCSVSNPGTLNASLEFALDLNDGSTVTESISGAKLWDAISAFAGTGGGSNVSAVIAPDPDNLCDEIATLTIDGQSYELEPYVTKSCCNCWCGTMDATGTVTIQATTTSGFTVEWGDGATSPVPGGTQSLSHQYTGPDTYQLMICQTERCDDVTDLTIEGFSSRQSKVCNGCS